MLSHTPSILFRRSLLLFVALLLCGQASLEARPQQTSLKVLMIGNSYSIQTRQEIWGFANADPTVSLQLELAANGGWTTQRHYDSRLQNSYDGGRFSLESKLRQEAWDFVVVQEQSTRPSQARLGVTSERTGFAYGMTNLTQYIRQEAPSATVLYFQTWPRDFGHAYLTQFFQGSPKAMQLATTEAYARAAKITGARVAPVGNAWTYSMYRRTGLGLHSGDGSHPGQAGRYLTGAVFYGYFFKKSPLTSPYTVGLPAADEQWMRAVADLTLRN